MVDQTTVNGRSIDRPAPLSEANRSRETTPPGLFSRIVELSELQYHLLIADLKESSASIRHSLALAALAACLLIAALPILMLAAAAQLESSLELPRAASLAIVSGTSVVLAAILGLAGFHAVKKAATRFTRSRAELEANLRGLKQAVSGHW